MDIPTKLKWTLKEKTEDLTIVAATFNNVFSYVTLPISRFVGPPNRAQLLRQPVASLALPLVDEEEVARVVQSQCNKDFRYLWDVSEDAEPILLSNYNSTHQSD